MEFKKLNTPTLKELFISEMEGMILSGKLEVGEKLPPERELAKSMQVSRAVVNSGIAELEKKGFLVVRPRVGTFVEDYRKNGTVETLVSIMHYNGGMLREKETRSVLEARIIFMNAAATLAIDNASDEEICGLEPYVDALRTCTDPEEASSLIFKFSHEISYISGNSLLPLFFISFKDLVCNLWVRFSRAYGVPALYQSAYDIYHFLLARDKEGAVNYITSTTQESINGSRTFYQVH